MGFFTKLAKRRAKKHELSIDTDTIIESLEDNIIELKKSGFSDEEIKEK